MTDHSRTHYQIPSIVEGSLGVTINHWTFVWALCEYQGLSPRTFSFKESPEERGFGGERFKLRPDETEKNDFGVFFNFFSICLSSRTPSPRTFLVFLRARRRSVCSPYLPCCEWTARSPGRNTVHNVSVLIFQNLLGSHNLNLTPTRVDMVRLGIVLVGCFSLCK